MKLILFRHAHKGFTPFDDPELSLQGFEQSARLVELIKQQLLPEPGSLLVSPKRRASQTFYPLSKQYNLKLDIQADLDQHSPLENAAEFRNRVQNFIHKMDAQSSSQNNIFVCTHYDWIEEAMTLINCDKDLNSFEFSHWSPTQFVIFELQNKLWKFVGKGSAK